MVHGCMVYTERAEVAAVSCGTSRASAVSTPLRWTFKKRAIKIFKKLFTHVESHASAVSVLESGEQSCIKEINSNNNCSLCVHFNLFCVCMADWNKRDKSVTNYDQLFIYVFLKKAVLFRCCFSCKRVL